MKGARRVTLSGGEPLAQPEFAAALLEQCKDKGINTALETTGYVKRKFWSRYYHLLICFI
ncbi:radical SAM protein [Sodalis ligni]|uniref:4Fe-4S cluster-binding domain-containing protein n=1 Tax=Sodalis ligni TaxID=2697027 RepID=UPI001BDF2400|nr:radical SAM protein [Sodalis ligni]